MVVGIVVLVVMAAVGVPIAAADTGSGTAAPDPVEVTVGDLTGDGTKDIKLSNGKVFVQMNGDHLESRTGISAAGPVGGDDVTGRMGTNPKTPTGYTTSTTANYQSTVSFEVVANNGTAGAYKIVREYTLDGVEMQIIWEVRLYAGDRFAVTEISYKNTDDTGLKLDQDRGDIHDGIQLFSGVALDGRSGNADDYKFHLVGEGTTAFTDTYRWSTYAGVKRGTVFDSTDAVTVGLLSGATSPKMWITTGSPSSRLDFMVNEVTLDPGETASYTAAVGIHDGGSEAPTTTASSILETATLRADGVLPNVNSATVVVDATDTQANTTTQANVTLSQVPDGLQTFEITVSVDNGSVAQIGAVTAGAIGGNAFEVTDKNATSVTFRAADFAGAVQSGDGLVRLATLELVETAAGNTSFSVQVTELTSDNSEAIESSISTDTLVVEARPFTGPIPGVDTTKRPTDPDGDGLYEDINGDGEVTFEDATALAFAEIEQLTGRQVTALDFDGDGDVDFDDSVELAFSVS